MKTVNIREAKTHLSRLVQAAAKGEPFIIAKAGKPLVEVVPVDAPTAPKRFDFMRGQFTVLDDFDTTDREEIEKLFYGGGWGAVEPPRFNSANR
jgi:prevent-host-death family protein